MKLLLDTHILLWGLLEPVRLAKRVLRELQSLENEIWLSPISIWEIHILAEKGRIVLNTDPSSWLRMALKTLPYHEARMNHEIAICSRTLKLTHEDPADRFLAATAFIYDLTLVTADKRLFVCEDISILKNR
jgi:PIN domain nuclease of toxin-antitoxin system